ncbi:MAG TPA: S41 family peptidase, partial [Planctomycetota bacterium]|nr:S41 family peptidase [Planctomycetota bacterium]
VVRSIVTVEKGVKGEWATEGQPEEDIIKRLKGEPGTNVVLKVMRRGMKEPKEYDITRDLIHIPALEAELLPGGVGYFDVQQFGREATDQLVHEIEGMKPNGLRGVVLDLRNNPGGFLDSARDMVSVFVPKGTKVCYTESRDRRREDVVTVASPVVAPDVPVVVLVNGYSASASEITAGALQDAGRAEVVGEHTYGKGSVQKIFALSSVPDEQFTDQDGNGLHDAWEPFDDRNHNGKFDAGPRIKLTVDRWFLPGGRNVNTEYDHTQRKTNRGGIEPDVEVKPSEVDLAKYEETVRLFDDDAFKNYVRDRVPKDLELFTKLALSDDKDPKRYPGFDELYAQLKTKLDRNDVRRMLRVQIRDKVAEERGRMFPGFGTPFGSQGDVQEDLQLREAISIVLTKLHSSFDAVPEYRSLLEHEKALGIVLGPKSGREAKKDSASPDSEPDDDGVTVK